MTEQNGRKVSDANIKTMATRFWKFLNTNSQDTFIDADIKVVSLAIGRFLNKDIIGKKIIVLGDKDQLDETASAIAIFLKRHRHLFKSEKQKNAVQRVKILHQYYSHRFWNRSKTVRKSRRLLNSNLRRMTAKLIEVLSANKKQLEGYFNIDQCWDQNLFLTDVQLKQRAKDHGYVMFTICQMHQEPIALNRQDVVFCSNEDCPSKICPFESNMVLEPELVFFSSLQDLFEQMGKIKS